MAIETFDQDTRVIVDDVGLGTVVEDYNVTYRLTDATSDAGVEVQLDSGALVERPHHALTRWGR